MRIKPRKMKTYVPRRRKHSKVLQKQQLEDLERLLNMDLGSFLILAEEGTKKQIQAAKAKMRIDILKYGNDMEKIARNIGDIYYDVAHSFIQSLTKIAQDSSDQVDPAPIKEHYKISENLHRLLRERLSTKAA